MTGGSPDRRLIVAALILLAALGGCQDSPSPKFYTLAARPATPTARFPKTITVKRVELAKYLDRPQMARHTDPYVLSLSEFDRWGEGLSDMVTRVLVEDLAQRLPGSQVYAATGPLTLPSADLTLEINIDRFEPDSGGAVVLAAQWVVHGGRRRDEFRAQQIRVATAGGDAADQVVAMSDALGQLASQIAVSIAA